ncbi:MAG: hypothetical protein V7709_16185 [Halioglobus sp.]
MSFKLIPALAASIFLMTGFATSDTTAKEAVPEKGDPNFLVARNAYSDQLYLNPDASPGARAFREVFIAPLNLSKLQVIQPEGVSSDQEWEITDIEDGILQNAMVNEFSAALSFESAYNMVDRRADADMIIHTTAVAIHPYANKAEVAAGAKSGGAITISLALINAETGKVMVRTVDTKSTDNIWAFNEVDNEEEAVNLIFRAWGNSMRRGLLHLQGRSSDPLMGTLQLKEQTGK